MRKSLGTQLTGGPLSSPPAGAMQSRTRPQIFPVAENCAETAHILPVFIIFLQGILFINYFIASHAFELINICSV